MIVYLLTTGSGFDGDEWGVEGIYSTRSLAEIAKDWYERPRLRKDGSTYTFEAQIEEWEVNPPLELAPVDVAERGGGAKAAEVLDE